MRSSGAWGNNRALMCDLQGPVSIQCKEGRDLESMHHKDINAT